MVLNIYIDLSGLEPDSASAWTFQGDRTQAGLDCEQQFLMFINTAQITRDVGDQQ